MLSQTEELQAHAQKVLKEERRELELLEARHRGDRAGFVYFYKTAAGVKIGRSKNPHQRINGLRTGSGDGLLVCEIYTDDMYELEKCAHNGFSFPPHKRLHGEWFEIDEDTLEWQGWTCQGPFEGMDRKTMFVEDYEMERRLLIGNIRSWEDILARGWPPFPPNPASSRRGTAVGRGAQ